MDDDDWRDLHHWKKRIDRLRDDLDAALAERRDLMRKMHSEGIRTREIGAYWGISNVAVVYALGLKGARGPRQSSSG